MTDSRYTGLRNQTITGEGGDESPSPLSFVTQRVNPAACLDDTGMV